MNEKTEYQKGRAGAMAFGGIVYVGVVFAASTLFISFVLTAFPQDQYLTRFVMTIAGLLIGASMIAFPYALHTWAISGTHRMIAIGLYYGEMAIIALNTIVSFAALLYKFAGAQMPGWMAWYEPFSIGSIIYTLFAWGTLFLTDPSAKAKAKELESEQRFDERVAQRELEYLDSIEGEQSIMNAANAKIAAKFVAAGTKGMPQHFGAGRQPEAAPTQWVVKEATTEKPEAGDSFRTG